MKYCQFRKTFNTLKRDVPLSAIPSVRACASKFAKQKDGKSAAREALPDASSKESFAAHGDMFFKEFRDVVILRTVHRTYDPTDDRVKNIATEEERQKFLQDSDKFQEIMEKMSDLSWTSEEHAWLASARNRSVLARTEEGRREVDSFEDAPILIDTRKQRQTGEDGADRMNALQLRKVASRQGVPILHIKAARERTKDVSEAAAAAMDADEFKGLASSLQLCVGARVLLTQNLCPEYGLMNGALGVVKGFVFPENFNPESSDSKERAPVCVIVEFDE